MRDLKIIRAHDYHQGWLSYYPDIGDTVITPPVIFHSCFEILCIFGKYLWYISCDECLYIFGKIQNRKKVEHHKDEVLETRSINIGMRREDKMGYSWVQFSSVGLIWFGLIINKTSGANLVKMMIDLSLFVFIQLLTVKFHVLWRSSSSIFLRVACNYNLRLISLP